jgi:hypothetical protein
MADEGRAEGKAHECIQQQEDKPEGDRISNDETDTTEDYDNDPTPIASREGTPPPLPPRPSFVQTPSRHRPQSPVGSLRIPGSSSRPHSSSRTPLPSRATTALSLADVHVQSHVAHDDISSSPTSRQISFAGFRHGPSRRGSEGDDTASVMSYAPTLEAGGDMESMLGDVEHARATPGMKPLTPLERGQGVDEEGLFSADPTFDEAFEHEFDELDDITSDGLNEG